nr:retrovirus-related Pol polyprotein from transposon TNT 1-94 [Tanacetum cinerariifolium]
MEPEQDQQDNDAGPSVQLARKGKRRRTPSYLQDFVSGEELDAKDDEANAIEIIQQDPTRFEDALKDIKWKEAMDREIEMIEKNQTWQLVELPKDAKCIRVKWVFKTKLNERGEIENHKARLVAKGYGQEYGIDYTEVYAPVARMDTIRLMLALAAQRG